MNERPRNPQPPPPGPGLGLNDVYYVLFRHKWLILGGCGAGLVAALALYLLMPTPYVSQAKLLVRYVQDTRSVGTPEKDSVVKSPDERGDSIMNSEVEILTSRDLAEKVAGLIGPARIMAQAGGGTNAVKAASVIAAGLSVESPKRSTILQIRFQHPDSTLVQEVLNRLIESYLEKHLAIHSAVGVSEDYLRRKKDELNATLLQTEDALRTVKTNAGIISLEDSKKALNDQIFKTRQDLFTAQASLAESRAALDEMQKLMPSKSDQLGVPPETLDQYKNLCARLEGFRKMENDLLLKVPDDSPRLTGLRDEIAKAEKKKKNLEGQFPKLAGLNIPAPDSRAQTLDPAAEQTHAIELEARIKELNTQLQGLLAEAAKVDTAGAEIIRLQRDKDQLEKNLSFYVTSLEQARVEAALGTGSVSNINPVQAPTPPALDATKKIKPALIALAVGVLGSIGLAFVLELFLDPRIKRSADVEKKLHLSLFLAIPEVKRNGHARLVAANPDARGASPAAAEAVPAPAVAPHPASNNGLKLYHETLRDRLLFYFHSRNMTHKPKLVGVTSCSPASGATTVAAGLAAALSETGEGNVLLVDMNLPGGAVHPFHDGKPGCGLQEVLDGGRRSDALVQQNLYLASAGHSSGGNGGLLPRRFADLMPKLKASDYDFIIFDLPPVSQTSATSNLAGMLDMTFLVLEAEKTHRDAAARAAAKFAESQANVAAVLNKARTYVPSWLHQEI